MAILKFGAPVAGLRGTLLGATYSANLSGPYVRAWSQPPSNPSFLQNLERARISQWGEAWAGLTSAQRSDWDSYAADPAQELTNSLGEAYYLSGWLWFVKINERLNWAGQSQRSDAPTATRPINPGPITTYYWESGGSPAYRLDWTSGYFGSNAIVTAAVLQNRASRTNADGQYRLLAADYSPGSDNQVFTTELANVWGTLGAPNSQVFSRTWVQDTQGQRSAPWTEFAPYGTSP